MPLREQVLAIASALRTAFASGDDRAINEAIAALALLTVTETPEALLAGYSLQETLTSVVASVSESLRVHPSRTTGQQAAHLNRVMSVVRRIEATQEDAKHAVRMIGVEDKAREVGDALVWVSERNACPRCLDLAGSVCLPGGVFTGRGYAGDNKARRPPRHPHCRCEIRRVDPADADGYAVALRREADRSLAVGTSDYASRSELSKLAARALDLAPYLPKSVLAKASRLART